MCVEYESNMYSIDPLKKQTKNTIVNMVCISLVPSHGRTFGCPIVGMVSLKNVCKPQK